MNTLPLTHLHYLHITNILPLDNDTWYPASNSLQSDLVAA